MHDHRRSFMVGWFVVATTACGTEVVQTAERRMPGPMDCSAPRVDVTLPSDVNLDAGSLGLENPLVAQAYAIDAGPGILVASRDAFRLYVNGELLAQSTESLKPVFVGYSFLPGNNVVAIEASGAGRSASLLARIDELERSLVSDSHWKISHSADANWNGLAYDDSGWASVIDQGLAESKGECAQASAPFVASAAHWIGGTDPASPTVYLRLAVPIIPSGFGRATTGGDRSLVVKVNDFETFRDAVSNDDTPRVIVIDEGLLDFRVTSTDAPTQTTCPTVCDSSDVTQYVILPKDTTCSTDSVVLTRNERKIRIRSNKTIVGLGRGAQLRGAWFDLSDSSNVILRNLTLFDVNPDLIEAGDGLTLDASSRIWVDHCTFKWISDGFTDLNAGTTETTFSWSRFDGQNDAACRGRHLRSSEVVDSDATYHHCIWQHVDGRAPFAHGAGTRAHLYNNVVNDALDYAVGSGCQAEVLLEGSSFEAVTAATNRRDCVETPGEVGLIRAPVGSNEYASGSNTHLTAGVWTEEPRDAVFTPPYPYEVEPATEMRDLVSKRAGAGSLWATELTLE